MKLDPGMTVCASDGCVGTLRDLVVDPITKQLTHLVVDTHDDVRRAHLIPFGAVHPEATVGRSEVVLLWTCAEVRKAPHAQQEDFVATGAVDEGRIGIGPEAVVRAWPFFRGCESTAAPSYAFGVGRGRDDDAGETIVTTRIEGLPRGTIEIARRTHVVAGDDQCVGRVDGFVVDPGRGITHLVVEQGHRACNATIPIGEVGSATRHRVQLACNRAAIGRFPLVAFDRCA